MEPGPAPERLPDQVQGASRLKDCYLWTEQVYIGWIKHYIYLHRVRHLSEAVSRARWRMGDPD
jgi:hypothetical protein